MELKYKVVNQDDEDHTVGLHRIEVELCNNKYENSAQEFSTVNEAIYEISVLSELTNCPYVAKGTYIINHNNKYVVLLEPLVSLNTWIKKKKEEKTLIFWNYDKATSKCIGIGRDLRNVFFQVGKALESIHKAQRFHRNISKGVMMGKDEKVRICLFKEFTAFSDYAKTQSQLQDLRGFRQLLNDIINMYRPKNGLQLPNELDYFLMLFDEIPEESKPKVIFQIPSEFRAFSKWIYNAVLFWKQQKRIFFLDALNECLEGNVHLLVVDGFLRVFTDWKIVLYNANQPSFVQCLTFNSGAKEYSYDFGIIRFIKNYKKHYRDCHSVVKTEAEAVEFVTRYFPNFYEQLYYQVFRRRGLVLNFALGRKKTLDDILGIDYSFFDMDDCC